MAKMSIPILVDWESIKDHLAKSDIVEVIRCKECKWHKPKYPGERPTCLIYLGDWHDDDYCSRAEREQNEQKNRFIVMSERDIQTEHPMQTSSLHWK